MLLLWSTWNAAPPSSPPSVTFSANSAKDMRSATATSPRFPLVSDVIVCSTPPASPGGESRGCGDGAPGTGNAANPLGGDAAGDGGWTAFEWLTRTFGGVRSRRSGGSLDVFRLSFIG